MCLGAQGSHRCIGDPLMSCFGALLLMGRKAETETKMAFPVLQPGFQKASLACGLSHQSHLRLPRRRRDEPSKVVPEHLHEKSQICLKPNSNANFLQEFFPASLRKGCPLVRTSGLWERTDVPLEKVPQAFGQTHLHTPVDRNALLTGLSAC